MTRRGGNLPPDTTAPDGRPPLDARGRSGWRATLLSRWALLSVTSLCYWTATQAVKPMLALRLQELGSGDAVIGLVLGVNSLVAFALALPAGRTIDRLGLRVALTAGLAGMVVVGAALAVAPSVQLIAVAFVGEGVVELAAWLAMQALASQAGSGAPLQRQLALFSFAWGTGIAIGPAIGSALYGARGFGAVGLFYAGIGGVGLLSSLVLPPVEGGKEPRQPVPLRAAVREMWGSAAVRTVLLSSFVVLFIYGIRNSFYPLLLERRGLPVDRIGLLLSIMGGTSLVVRLVLPAVQRRVEAQRLLVGSMWLAIVAMTVTPWLGTIWLYVPAAALVGVGLGVNPPVTVQLMAEHTSTRERGLAMGMRVSSNRLSQIVQPLLFGVVAAAAGMPLAFASGGLLLAVVATAARGRRAA